jgi:hypothetical protein
MTEHPNTDSLRVAAPTTVIKAGDELVTPINVFTVDPTVQRQLLDVPEEATEQVMRHQPGFVSANLHASLDGTQVTNYAQWRRREGFEAMLANLVAREHRAASRRHEEGPSPAASQVRGLLFLWARGELNPHVLSDTRT